jgi:hypothetical protein
MARALSGTVVLVCWAAVAVGGCSGGHVWRDDQSKVPDGGSAFVDQTPEPYLLPEGGAPPCELSADCPAGTYCDLGQCFQVCNTEESCPPELFCNARGRCVATYDAPTDPAPQTTFQGSAHLAESEVFVGADESRVELQLLAQPADLDISYRLESRAAWLATAQTRGSFTESVSLALTVDRSLISTGTHGAVVVVHTTVGTVRARVIVEQNLTGTYQGSLQYDSPRPLGPVPVQLQLIEAGDSIDVQVVSALSPTFPVVEGQPLTTVARVRQGVLEADIVQLYTEEHLAECAVPLGPLGRIFEFELQSTPTGGLTGSFVEYWSGLFPDLTEVRGTLSLARLPAPDEVLSFEALPPQQLLASSPRVEVPPLGYLCPAAAEQALDGRDRCRHDASAEEMVRCADALMAISVPVEEADLVAGAIPGGDASWAEVCEQDLLANRRPTGRPSEIDCFRPANLDCAASYYAAADRAGHGEGGWGLAQVAAARAGVALLLTNDELAQAYRVPFGGEVDVENQVLDHLGVASHWSSGALAELFNPLVLQAMRTLNPAVAADHDYHPLRRLAQLVARDWQTTNDESRLLLRTQPESSDNVRSMVADRALSLLLASIALVTIESSQAAPQTPEVMLLANALPQLGARTIEATLAEALLGLSETALPYPLDGENLVPGQTSNFLLLLKRTARVIDNAVALEEEARRFSPSHSSVWELQRELEAVEAELMRTVVNICGGHGDDGSQPDLENCGHSAGALAENTHIQRAAADAIERALTRIGDLGLRVLVQEQRLMQVHGVSPEAIRFVDEANAEVLPDQLLRRHLDAAARLVSLVAHTAPAAPGEAVVGAAALALDEIQTHIKDAREQLFQMHELQPTSSDQSEAYLGGISTIKEMLIAMAQLSTELGLAAQQAVMTAHQAASLVEQRDVALAELELLVVHGRRARRLNDPDFRLLQSPVMLRANRALDEARLGLHHVARAFEVETSYDFSPIESWLWPALDVSELVEFQRCLEDSFADYRQAFRRPAIQVDEISLARDILGITGPVSDAVTGEVISATEQFQRLLFAPANIAADGSVSLRFATNVDSARRYPVLSLCNTHLRGLQVRLVGHNVGDDLPEVTLQIGGTSFLRRCQPNHDVSLGPVVDYHIEKSKVVSLAAAANGSGEAAQVFDRQLFGRPLASSDWLLTLRSPASRSANTSLDLSELEDIILAVEHSALFPAAFVHPFEADCGALLSRAPR